VHRDELVIVVRGDQREGMREPELQPHHDRQYQGDQPDRDRGDRVLDGDDLVVLAPDVLRDESLRVMQRMIAIGECHVGHQ
jgi:hypothetical protein